MKTLIFLNGDYKQNSKALYKFLAKNSSLIIAANGGFAKAKSFKIKVHEVIGDLDSLSCLPQKEVLIHRFPKNKDKTDGELALNLARKRKSSLVYVVGAFGGRFDQTITNFFLASKYARYFSIIIPFGTELIIFPNKKDFTLNNVKGTTISIIPITKIVEKISSHGLKWTLRMDNIFRESSRCISNIAEKSRVNINFRRGKLCVSILFPSENKLLRFLRTLTFPYILGSC